MPKFRTKARAVDLLGRGQIADLPTSICELWKNGYDAYADNISCDLYLKGYKGLEKPIFTLSDDGTGMSRKDLKEKWIVLGTDSRVRGAEPLTEEQRLGKPYRIPLGEKGIGRLSVAYLGSPMLMLTKKKNENCQVLYMDWRILENFNLYLDDVNLPIGELTSSCSIYEIVNDLINQFKENLKVGVWDEHEKLRKILKDELDNFDLYNALEEDFFSDFVKMEKHGTMFIIFNPHEQLLELAETDVTDIDVQRDTVDYLRSSLSGIHNVFKEKPTFKISFLIHDQKGRYDLVAKQNFFEREDMFNVDHWISGSFNKEGFFEGEIQVFNRRFKHTFQPRRPPGKTSYGPFKIELGWIEGDPKNSKLPREQWDSIKKKLNVFSGLYLYRDNFRVLPYGRADYDFLKFEERRSFSATYYHFSYRRMLGYIGITRENNPNLKDKAGREGFIVNRAYREFRDDLIAFFTDISVRFLRMTPIDGTPTLREEQLEAIRKRNERLFKAEKKRSKMTKTRFKKELKENSEKINLIIEESSDLFEKLKTEKSKATLIYNNISSLIFQLEEKKSNLKKMKLVKPKRVKLTNSQTNKYYAYREKFDYAMQFYSKCDNIISETQIMLSKENLKEEFKKRYEDLRNKISFAIKEYESRFNGATNTLDEQIEMDTQKFGDFYAEKTRHIILTGNEENEEIEKRIRSLEKIHDSIMDEIEEKYESFIRHVEDLSFDIDDDLLVGWYKEQYEKINEKVEAMHELAQLGMAIEIIDHQFNVLYAEMSTSIHFFKRFADKNPKVKYNFNQLRQAFEHLETNHQLLTPLYRTMRRSKTEIKGLEIKEYLSKFFDRRFQRHRINLTTDPSFDEYIFYTYESVIKPIFINIINNALYWLIPSEDRKINITYENEKILIMNSGQKIEYADLENIFTLFFTRKPGGRGIGLYLARTNLHTIGYEIYATNDKIMNRLKGACFVIKQLKGAK